MSPLPTLCAPGLPTRSRADARGGFAWWYVDLVDERGDGAVVVVGLGLPFLPGYASAARAGRAPPAGERPSVCVAHVRQGKLAFWAFHERDPERVRWEPGRARFGEDELEVVVHRDRVALRARLSGRLPGAPWAASLEVDGPLRRETPGEPVEAEHEWTVLSAVARGRFELRVGRERAEVVGRAYVDRNAGDAGLEGHGLRAWTWGRLAFPSRERIWYVAEGTGGERSSLLLTVEADGASALRRDGVRAIGRRYGVWGLGRPAAVDLGPSTVALPAPLEDSPFYARFRVDGEEGGAKGRGFAEVCRADRLDAAWFRPLVAMTVCHDHRPPSVWLPLFGGPREGRVRRLVGRR